MYSNLSQLPTPFRKPAYPHSPQQPLFRYCCIQIVISSSFKDSESSKQEFRCELPLSFLDLTPFTLKPQSPKATKPPKPNTPPPLLQILYIMILRPFLNCLSKILKTLDLDMHYLSPLTHIPSPITFQWYSWHLLIFRALVVSLNWQVQKTGGSWEWA